MKNILNVENGSARVVGTEKPEETAETFSINAMFKPNNHSVYRIDWQSVSPRVISELDAVLRAAYRFDAVSSIEQVGEWGRMSSNFKVRGTREGRVATVLLRKNLQVRDEESIRVVARIISELAEQGMPVPVVILDESGSPFAVDGGQIYQLFTFIAGDHYCGTAEELQTVAEGVAAMHRAMRNLSCHEAIRAKPPVLPAWNSVGFSRMIGIARARQDESDRRILAEWPLIENAIERVLTGKERLAGKLSLQPVHCDLHPQNTIFADGRLAAFLDFDDVRMGERARDVAGACHRFVRQYVVNAGRPWEETLADGVRAFCSAYESADPLTADDRIALPVMLMDELLRKVHFLFTTYYEQGTDRFIGGGELTKMMTLLREAECFAELFP